MSGARGLYEWLDRLVIWQTFCLLLFACTVAFFGERARPWLRNHDSYIDISAMLYCISIGTWMSLGGSGSRVWDWIAKLFLGILLEWRISPEGIFLHHPPVDVFKRRGDDLDSHFIRPVVKLGF